jgi:hypothetical protein
MPGRRDEAVGVSKEFMADMIKEFGGANGRVLTASLGPTDSTVVTEVEHKTLAEFENVLDKMNKWPKMQTYAPKWNDMVVPGTHRFEVYRIYK